MEFIVRKRRWLVESHVTCTGMHCWLISTPCECGRLLKAHVYGGGLGSEGDGAQCDSLNGCGRRLNVPAKVQRYALEHARKDFEEAWERRAAAGGPRGWIPI